MLEHEEPGAGPSATGSLKDLLMKIALLGNLASIHLIRWTNSLAARGHEVHVLSCHTPTEPLDHRANSISLPVPAPIGYFLNALHLRRELDRLNPDLLHVHFASGYGTLGSLSRFHPRLLSVWGSDVYLFPERSPLHRWLLRYTLRSAECISSTSEAMAAVTGRLAGRRVEVVPFGIDVDRFQPSGTTHDPAELTIGTARTLAPRYGVDLLIRAFADLFREMEGSTTNRRLHLLIIGDGPERNRLERLATGLGVRDRLEFGGHIAHESMPAALNRMDVFVAPSRSESFGVAVLEASACGLPVVVFDVGGLPEVVLAGQTGLVVRRESVPALTSALAHLAEDARLRDRMGRAGRQHVLKRYRWRDSIDEMEQLYQQIVEDGSIA